MTTDEFWKYWEEHCSSDVVTSRLIMGFLDGFLLQIIRSDEKVYSYAVHDAMLGDRQKIETFVANINNGTATLYPVGS